jgi:hypothetical protein
MRIIKFLIAIILILIAINVFFIFYKPPITVPDDYLTIQAAVNAALPGDRILVKKGIYDEQVVIGSTKNNLKIIAKDKNVELEGTGVGTAFTLNQVVNVKIQGFRISNYNIGIHLNHANGCISKKNKFNNLETEGVFIEGGSANKIVKNKEYIFNKIKLPGFDESPFSSILANAFAFVLYCSGVQVKIPGSKRNVNVQNNVILWEKVDHCSKKERCTMKNVMLSGIIGAIIAVVSILFMTIYYGWKSKDEALCLPELEKLLHSGTMAVIVQTLIVAALGFIIFALINPMKIKIKGISHGHFHPSGTLKIE